ncbi:CRISPR-associated endonuclease Cas1 [Dolosicoccus paucivorans]|uniref:CRISPR-associated endonuclease Cas1 n=1 Tax=Dolosicoccus paucivorans TaxID=84521 RepID=A0A1G8JUJ8_9LACT|nr:CRISPR-associated endonuclease Cas1 [Dolosicoccus paucivorans]PMB85060.1 CRISPR-associated endonuclease Cas1 [Dolosicoccus paucivorans]PMC58984.1 CRISPR-associated endonuclease Cas1 [Dolosicoccus paucivorans]SDI34763.1 CRISPR-associated protein, Cas1 family [Dolosicoccus paucivorans]
MKEIYIFESAQSLHYRDKKLIVQNKEGKKAYEVAVSQVKRVNIFGNPTITTQLLKALALNKKEVHYYSQNGKYLMSMNLHYAENYSRQQEQILALLDDSFSLALSKRLIQSKIKLQAELLKAYDEDGLLTEKDYVKLNNYYQEVEKVASLESILGYEGRSAKTYFYYLGLLVPTPFKFSRRSKRPPKDPFNALLSFGYSILYSYIIGAIIKSGLNPGFSALHQTRKNHATLASDLMEEWRPVLVDDVVMQLLISEKLTTDDFIKKPTGEVYLSADARRLFVQAFRERMLEKHFYFGKDRYRFVFLNSVDQQIDSLKKAFKYQDPLMYQTIGG